MSQNGYTITLPWFDWLLSKRVYLLIGALFYVILAGTNSIARIPVTVAGKTR